MPALTELGQVLLIGAGATLVMDLWLLVLMRFGIQGADWALVGRWIGHLAHGRLVHESIAKAQPIPRERALGWLTHYGVGIAYAGLLVAVAGIGWIRTPTWLPALATGIATLVVPLFVMQPAMGLGVAATKTPAPLASGLRSLANHLAYGCGLFATAALWAAIAG